VARWHGPRGIEIEIILLDSGPLMKVTQQVNGRRYLLGYCATIADVTKHVDLADLVEVIPFPAAN
jgi:hypothetical protein